LLSAWPDPDLPSWLSANDKIAHAGLYSVLGGCLGYGWRRSSAPPPHWLLVGLGALYAATDEWHQAFVPHRAPDLGDWAADVSGVVAGYLLMLFVARRLARRTKPEEMEADV
jgi:VanZ family protein